MFIKNNLKLLLLGFITPLFCLGVSFGVDPYTIEIDGCSCISNMSNCLSESDRIYLNNSFYDYPVCFDFVYEDYQGMFNAVSIHGNYFNGSYAFNYNIPYKILGFCDVDISRLLNSFDNITFQGNVNMCQSLPMTITFFDKSSFVGECPDCSSIEQDLQTCSSDLNSCSSSLNTLKSNFNTLSGNYSTCQSDLASCQNNGSNCDTLYGVCVENLSGCNADKVSLNNNIDSLTLQLQNCLGQSCDGSGNIGSGTYFNQYSLYWTDDETDYSTPITNNLFLPLGYKGKINEDNILSIAKINTLETAYQFSESDKPVVMNSMGFVMLFFLGSGLLIVVIMYLRRFISKK